MDFEHWLILVTIVVALTMAFFVYRPFCHFICPFGFVSWIAEHISLVRVKINHEKCTKCGLCIKACPGQAAEDRVLDKMFCADCFSCARCLNVCPQDAIRYGFVFSKTSGEILQKQPASKKDAASIWWVSWIGFAIFSESKASRIVKMFATTE